MPKIQPFNELRRLHREVWFPEFLEKKLPNGLAKLEYSLHASDEMKQEKYKHIKAPHYIDFDKSYIFEADERCNSIEKIVCRIQYDHDFDLILALVCPPKNNSYTVKTVWLNRRSDKHTTLRADDYYKPS